MSKRLRTEDDVDDGASGASDAVNDTVSIPPFEKLPAPFRAFLTENKIPPDAYNLPKLYRFIRYASRFICNFSLLWSDQTRLRICRVNPRKPIEATELQQQLTEENKDSHVELQKIEWIDIQEPGTTFFRLPASTPVSSLPAYSSAHIYGIDLSSACVVLALDPQPDEHIADVCCAPGAKTSFIVDLMVARGALRAGKQPNEFELKGSVTAIDVSRDRLGATRSLLAKFVLLESPTTFSAHTS
jgi:16S rRNA C967 or C1407 C5-methylase (RsmB/RsmF family)